MSGVLRPGSWWFTLRFVVIYSVVPGSLLCDVGRFPSWVLLLYSLVLGGLFCGLAWLMLWFSRVLISNEELSGDLQSRIWKLPADLREGSLELCFVPVFKGSMNLRERKKESWAGALGCPIQKAQAVDLEGGDILGFRYSL